MYISYRWLSKCKNKILKAKSTAKVTTIKNILKQELLIKNI